MSAGKSVPLPVLLARLESDCELLLLALKYETDNKRPAERYANNIMELAKQMRDAT